MGLGRIRNDRESWNYFTMCLPLFESYCYCTKESSARRAKYLCVDYHALNSLLPTIVKAHSKAQSVLSIVPYEKLMDYMLC